FTRKIKIEAVGISSSQIPQTPERQIAGAGMKVYADLPEMKEEFQNGVIHSYRNEHYTLIPDKEGKITLPEIKLAWFDVSKEARAVALLPERVLEVVPAPLGARKEEAEKVNNTNALQGKEGIEAPVATSDPVLYGLIAALAVLLFAAFFWVL